MLWIATCGGLASFDDLELMKALESMLDGISEASEVKFIAELDSIDGFFLKNVEIDFYRIG